MTVLMPSWYYEKKDLKRSPSILDGLDPDRESRYRREGARFIINVGTKMGLRYDTMATGVVYFHRFYMFHSFKTFPRYVTACCCLFLAGKVEETPKKCKDIIKTAKTFLVDSQFLQFGDDPKEEVMTLERILLQTIKFDLQVDHPYSHLLRYAKSLKGDKGKLQHMVQMAWTFINDSLCTTLCLQFEPEVIAIALMYLAGKLSKFEVVDWVTRTSRHNHWWDMFVEGMSVGLLEDICHQVLDLYSTPNPNADQDSPPATPPTKSTRKMSQPPSPMETCTSPAQVKPKVEAIVGQPIPRLEPGELKRKIPHAEPKKEPVEKKITKPIEGKAIPTIIHNSPPKIVKKSNTMQSDPQPPSPTSPVKESTPSKIVKVPEVVLQRSTSSEPAFSSGIATGNRVAFAHAMVDELLSSKSSIVAVTTNYSTAPPPPLPATYTQAVPAPPFYPSSSHETQSFSTVQQPPPPQMYPMQFQHPPPPPPPPNSSVPPPQYGSMPPFPPPPRPQVPPPPPPQHDFESGYHHRQPPPPGQFGPNFERPQRNLRPQFLLDHRNAERSPHPPNTSVPPTQYGSMPPYPPPPRPQAPPSPPQHDFESGYLHRQPPPPGQFGPNFERSPRNLRPRFLLDHRNAERGPRPPMGLLPKPRSSTSIAPVRITGSM